MEEGRLFHLPLPEYQTHIMLPSTSISITSSQTEENWLHDFDKTYKLLAKEDKHANDVRPCVFRIPQNVIETSPLAYTPQRMGLGPYHHLRPDFHMLQWHKLAVIKNFITPEKFKNLQALVIDKLVEMESVIRSCYGQVLELKDLTLAMILAIDAIFLLHILYNEGRTIDAVPDQVAKDLFMLENQIPIVILEQVRDALKLSHNEDDQQLSKLCWVHSPLPISLEYSVGKCSHLLAFLHHLIVSFQVKPIVNSHSPEYGGTHGIDCLPPGMIQPPTIRMSPAALITGVVFLVDTATNTYNNVNKNLEGAESFMQKIVQFFKKPTQSEEEISMPSVSQLQNSVKVKFVETGKGIQQIKFAKLEDGGGFHFQLPQLRMNGDSEVILRNLVEYEKVMVDTTNDPKSVTTVVSDYVFLMCGIIHSAKDVALLRKEEIIISQLSDDAIAKIFNWMKKSTYANQKWRLKEKSVVQHAIEAANKEYDKTMRGKASKLVKYVAGSSRTITFISVLLTILIMATELICQFYGCNATGFSVRKLPLFAEVPKYVNM